MATLRIGLTGGIASGKSSVARRLAERGFVVADADRLVAELYQPGGAGAAKVAELFGSDLLHPDGSVDHEQLATRVFADAETRRRLEREIHPLVGARFAEIAASTPGIAVFEAPLLVETGGHRNFDLLITVEAPPELRLRRAVERGLDEDSARARMAAQASGEQRRAVADRVIENDGSWEHLEATVDDLADWLRAQAE